MKTAFLTASLLCGLMAGGAVAQDATATGGGVKCMPIDAPNLVPGTRIFTRDGSDLSDAGEYPHLAKVSAIEGVANVDCQIGHDGYLAKCVVASESQTGYGLGQGLAVTVLKWAQTDITKPDHAAGNWLRFTTNWKLPADQMPARQMASVDTTH
ncbi:MAG: hypothetical protein WBQ60_11835 [Asticcacaulis sp.]